MRAFSCASSTCNCESKTRSSGRSTCACWLRSGKVGFVGCCTSIPQKTESICCKARCWDCNATPCCTAMRCSAFTLCQSLSAATPPLTITSNRCSLAERRVCKSLLSSICSESSKSEKYISCTRCRRA